MKKILIGTHNQGKYQRNFVFNFKKITKISPVSLNLASPKETSKTFMKTLNLKPIFFRNM